MIQPANPANSPVANAGRRKLSHRATEFSQQPYHRPHDPVIDLPVGLSDNETYSKTSLRILRRNVVIACTVFTWGALLIAFNSPQRNLFIAAGPLSSPHASLAIGANGESCIACHANAHNSFSGWLADMFSWNSIGNDPHQSPPQSQLCMACHAQTIDSEFAMSPHNMDTQLMLTKHLSSKLQISLDEVAARYPNSDLESLLNRAESFRSSIACSSCHQEHHGSNSLTALTDVQCQSCHGQTFHSFDQGHPEFIDYPYRRRTAIAFDHARHAQLHFSEKGADFDCVKCHQVDSQRNVQQLRPFQQACASCHNDQILDRHSAGIVLLSLPMLDMAALEAAGHAVGDWPLMASGDFDGPLPPLMRTMLLADTKARSVLQKRDANFEFFDLNAENPHDLQDAAVLVWAIKRLIWELGSIGPQAIQQRLELALKIKISDQELSNAITSLDRELFQTMADTWLPTLKQEMAISDQRSIEDLRQQSVQRDLQRPAKEVDNPTENNVSNSSTSHPSNPPQRSQAVNKTTNTAATVNFHRPSSVIEFDDLLLAENPLKELMAGKVPTVQIPQSDAAMSPRLVIDDRENSVAKTRISRPNNLAPVEASESSHSWQNRSWPQATDTDAPLFDILSRPSGWYRDDLNLKIVYLPQGHADPSLQSWFDLVAKSAVISEQKELKPLVDATLAGKQSGECASCHTVDRQAGGSFQVNWLPRYRNPVIREFTRFSHASHLSQTGVDNCQFCHQLELQNSNYQAFMDFDGQKLTSNFLPISRDQCVQCHQKQQSSTSCTLCHHYHVHSGNAEMQFLRETP